MSSRCARGLAKASRYVANRVAIASETRAEMRVVPSPWRRIVMRVLSAALASRSASRSASAFSAISGATTSRIRRPSRPSSFGPNSSAYATSLASASATASASTRAGSASSARRMTCACTSVTVPSRIPDARTGRSRSIAVASARSARASANRVRVWCANQPGCVLRTRRVSQVTRVGQDPQPQLGQLTLSPHQLRQRSRLVVGRHERRVHTRHTLEQGADVGDHRDDRVLSHRTCHGGPPLDEGCSAKGSCLRH